MKIIARITYLVLALITKVLGLAFVVAAVLWLLGLFEVAGNTVLALFVLSIVLALITGALMEMIKKRCAMKVLDACCGSKMFWFDREHKETVYMDNRTENTTLCDGRKLIVKPDIVADFREIPFENETFYLVVFDPPHLVSAGDTSFLKLKYGKLGPDWKEDIKQGLAECWRVLKQNGTLIFKWNEEQITLPKVRPLLPIEPILGQRRGKTIWLVFFKGE